MAVSDSFRAYLDDVLSPLGRITFKRVFGLDGVKAGPVLLGFAIDERIYLRTDEGDRAIYAREGGKPYSFTKRTGEHIVTSYYSVPDRLYDEPDELVDWARRAHAAALQAPSARARRAKNARKAAKTATAAKTRTAPRMRRRARRKRNVTKV